MAFAHNGVWFTVQNFRSLADGWSDKNPKECIGHKGLGFRSVLDITPAPHVLKIDEMDFFGFKFTWALNNGHIQEVLRRQSSLRAQYKDWAKHGQLCCPVMAIPGEAKKTSLGSGSALYDRMARGHYGKGFTTLFWFPASDREIDRNVLSDLGPLPMIADEAGRRRLLAFLEGEVTVLLPFLSSLEDVGVYDSDASLGRVSFSNENRGSRDGEITVAGLIARKQYAASFFQIWVSSSIPEHVRRHPDHWYWNYPDYQGLFPYGATGPFDAAFLQDALSRHVLEPVAWTSALAQKWA